MSHFLSGYDRWKERLPQYYDDEIEDEGIDWLLRAIWHLKPVALADEDQETPEFEAFDTLNHCLSLIEDEYKCRYCGEPTNGRRTYCSYGCAHAEDEHESD